MKIIDLDNKINENSHETLLALGNFDGLHLGHKLISEMVDIARRHQLKSAVLLFKDHSGKILYPSDKKFVLTTLADKLSVLERMEIDFIFIKKFDLEFSKIQPVEFLEFIIESTSCRGIVVGRDYRFGYKGKGNTDFLRSEYVHDHFRLYEVEDYCLDGMIVKSTLIRNLLQNGDVMNAAKYLGRIYSIEGTIIHGENRGHVMGFPTANLENDNYILPKDGVYYTISEIEGSYYPSMTAVGENKTFDECEKKIETYILNLSRDIYHKIHRVYFVEYMRDNVKFASVEELIDQLKKDKNYILEKDLHLDNYMLI